MDEHPQPTFIQRIFRSIRLHSILWLFVIIALAIFALAFAAGRQSVYSSHPELSSTEQANGILLKVSQLIQLPNEQPTMATINDAASAKKAQPFLSAAENGDILIVYQNAAEALLYRPSTNKLIAVGPVNTGAEQAQQPLPQPQATSTHATDTTKK